MDNDGIIITFTPAEADRFRAWQREQWDKARARSEAREAAEREPWESDPDDWKGRD